MAITKAQFDKYKAVSINGFKVDMHKIIYQIAHGDEFPQLQQIILDNANVQLILKVSFFRFYDKRAEYKTEVNEFKKSKDDNPYMMGGSGCFNLDISIEEIASPARFNFKHLLDLASGVDVTAVKEQALAEYNKKAQKAGA